MTGMSNLVSVLILCVDWQSFLRPLAQAESFEDLSKFKHFKGQSDFSAIALYAVTGCQVANRLEENRIYTPSLRSTLAQFTSC